MSTQRPGAPAPADAPAAAIAKALQTTVRMGRLELQDASAVSADCWEMCDVLLDVLIEQLPDDSPRRPGVRGRA